MAQHNEVLLQKLIELSGSVFSKNFSYLSHLNSQPCKILSPQCIAAITLPHGSSLCYHQATSRKSPSLSPAQSQTSFHFLCHLLQTQMLTPFFSALSTPHTCHSGALPPLLCSEFGFLPSAAVCSSYILSKRFGEPGLCYTALSLEQVPWMPLWPSLPVCIPFPTSHQNSYSGHLLLYMGCVLVFYPLLSTAVGSPLAAAYLHLPFFLVSVSLPHSVSVSLSSSPTLPLQM